MAYPYYMEAVCHLDEAISRADDQPVFYSFWWSGEEESPSRREHLRRQKIYCESMGLVGREIGIHFGLNALYDSLGGDVEAYSLEAGPMLRKDMEACRAIEAYFKGLNAEGDNNRPDLKRQELYGKKADAIEAYIL